MNTVATIAGSAESVASRDVDEFSRLVSARFAPLRVDSDRPGRFRGRILRRALGEVELFDVRANQHRVERSGSVAERTPKGTYMLHVQLSGVGTMRQDGREAVLQPGDMAFYDTDRAYSLSLDDRFHNAIVVFPQRLLDLPLDTTHQFTATRIPGSHGVAGLVAPFLARLTGGLDVVSTHSSLRLAHSTLDLIATVLRSDLGDLRPDAPAPRRRDALRAEVYAYIEDNLGDPALAPQQIAAANFISVRTLHGLFAREGTSVSAWIRSRRLTLVRDVLADRLHDHLPVGTIASRYGLIDAAHFSRLFKSAYGEAPSQFRRRLSAEQPST